MKVLSFLRLIKAEHDDIFWYTFPIFLLILVFQPQLNLALVLISTAIYLVLMLMIILPRIWLNALIEKRRSQKSIGADIET